MEIRKSTFDYSPSLIEYEGNYIRINFDVEQIELENGMDSSEGKKSYQNGLCRPRCPY